MPVRLRETLIDCCDDCVSCQNNTVTEQVLTNESHFLDHKQTFHTKHVLLVS